MTKDEATEIFDAARKWVAAAVYYSHATAAQQDQEFLALLNSMINDTQVESGTKLPSKTPAELAAENALCNAAYLAKKTE